MINALTLSPSIVAYCKHQKLGSEKGEDSQLKEHMVASFSGPEEKDPRLGMMLISFPCPEQ